MKSVRIGVVNDKVDVLTASHLTFNALIGRGYSDRKRIRSVITSLYKHRSSLVHTGTSKKEINLKGFEKINSKDLICEASRYVAKSIRAFISLGKIPVWDDYELRNEGLSVNV